MRSPGLMAAALILSRPLKRQVLSSRKRSGISLRSRNRSLLRKAVVQ
jgi:hypothetical protein